MVIIGTEGWLTLARFALLIINGAAKGAILDLEEWQFVKHIINVLNGLEKVRCFTFKGRFNTIYSLPNFNQKRWSEIITFTKKYSVIEAMLGQRASRFYGLLV